MPLDEKEGRLLLIGVLKRDNLSLLGCPVIEISTCWRIQLSRYLCAFSSEDGTIQFLERVH